MQMNEVEKEIQLRLNSIEMKIKKKEKELETYKALADKKQEQMLPTFGLR